MGSDEGMKRKGSNEEQRGATGRKEERKERKKREKEKEGVSEGEGEEVLKPIGG